MLKVLVPVGGLAVLLILVAAVIALTGGGDTPATTPPTYGAGDTLAPAPAGPRSELESRAANAAQASKGLDFPLDGSEWKDIGGGLKIWDVKEGSGKECPLPGERPGVVPVMHYTGWLPSGVEFDSSRKPGKAPLGMQLARLIAGWQRGVPGMKVGGVRRLLIPSELGYGARGQGSIPGGATLVFEMELLGVR